MKLIIETNTNPSHNLAREEVLLEEATEDTLYLWRNRPSVILGRYQNTFAEIDEKTAEQENIQVVRRLTGGGAVYHDLGNINFSYIFTDGNFEEKKVQGTQMMLEFLMSVGVHCYATGRNDICFLDGQGREFKVSGTAMTQKKKRGIFHGCLLFDCDLTPLGKVLTPSRQKLESKGITSVRARVANLKDGFPALQSVSAADFFNRWADYLRKRHIEIETSCAHEDEKIRGFMEERYANRQWNFGKNPVCDIENHYRFPVGTVELHLEVKGETVEACVFTGDFISAAPFQELETLLQGTPFTEEGIYIALEGLEL